MAQQDKVPGHNDATYGPVPKEDQLLSVEFLEIAPTPIIADRLFFIYLRGYLSESKMKDLGLLDESLVDAKLTVTSSVVYPGGDRGSSEPLTLPLRTMQLSDDAHLVIRDSHGAQVDHLPSSGRSDILLDFQIPTIFLRSGTWTFNVDARLGNEGNTCLFAMSVAQWLDGASG